MYASSHNASYARASDVTAVDAEDNGSVDGEVHVNVNVLTA